MRILLFYLLAFPMIANAQLATGIDSMQTAWCSDQKLMVRMNGAQSSCMLEQEVH